MSRVFGYDGDEIVPDEANAIRKANAALLTGQSLYGTAKQWNSAGIRTAKGGVWSGNTESRSTRVRSSTARRRPGPPSSAVALKGASQIRLSERLPEWQVHVKRRADNSPPLTAAQIAKLSSP